MPDPDLLSALLVDAGAEGVPIHCVDGDGVTALLGTLEAAQRRFAKASGFEAKPGRILALPGRRGIGAVLFGVEPRGRRRDPFEAGRLALGLPPGTYRFAEAPPEPESAALAWLLAQYRFGRYRKGSAPAVRLVCPAGPDAAKVRRIADAVALGRDLVNTPANDLGPEALAAAAEALAERHGATCRTIVGAALREEGFPLIHAVGRAAAQAPRLVDIGWGPDDAPRVTLVGKGVCYDTGGLDIKPSAAMALMKKDMGGAAAAMACAAMVMGAELPVRLRLLLPIVENAISGDAFRTGDVYPSRKGLSVEIGNTDAEGRLILADALALADEDAPDLLIDFATLTGAARVALGPDLPPFYTADDALAAEIAAAGTAVNDPVWRLPLWAPYAASLDGKTGEVNSAPGGGFAGSITAALFLAKFVEKARAYVHFDIYAWVPSARPGRPEGGEVQGARLVYALLETRYGARRRRASRGGATMVSSGPFPGGRR